MSAATMSHLLAAVAGAVLGALLAWGRLTLMPCTEAVVMMMKMMTST